AHAYERANFPYIPGLLSFREGPVILSAFEELTIRPDVIIFDGQGIAHPRGLGLASHLGILLDIPSIGCAKTALVGTWDEPPDRPGSFSPLIYGGQVVGDVLRTKERVRPVFVSPGHKVGRHAAREIVLACIRGYRLPEPTRQAHLEVNMLRRKEGT
ncbi:MAG: endonuclease V, partial [Treponemataceae bacterium]|nr:endonuclease V [Treponemataceae bacterium]